MTTFATDQVHYEKYSAGGLSHVTSVRIVKNQVFPKIEKSIYPRVLRFFAFDENIVKLR